MRSKLIQCDKCSKFYDPNQHQKCPYCPVPGLDVPDYRVEPTVGSNQERSRKPAETPTLGSPVRRPQNAEGVTVGVMPKKFHIDPVVGWLVCIEGKERGRDYRIYSDRNFLGRSDAMRICIKGDDTISREKHSIINFDARHNRFYIAPGEGRGNTYVNDAPVLEAIELKAWDIIEVGETKLVFVPFCGENFEWNKSGDANLRNIPSPDTKPPDHSRDGGETFGLSGSPPGRDPDQR